MFYFTCNHAWNWNKTISGAERVLKLFQQNWTCLKIFMSCNNNNFEIIWDRFRHDSIKFFQLDIDGGWNNFEILSVTFRHDQIKLFQTDVNEGWNNFEVIDFKCNHSIRWQMNVIWQVRWQVMVCVGWQVAVHGICQVRGVCNLQRWDDR